VLLGQKLIEQRIIELKDSFVLSFDCNPLKSVINIHQFLEAGA
jgi:hypothetical protein